MNVMLGLFLFAIVLMFITGFYCLLLTRNLIRVLIALEVLTKAVTLLIIIVGYLSGKTALAQSFVITLIIIEVVIIVVAAGIILGVFNHNDSLDTRKIRNLKG
jgi:multisubunit Na+/H+ antiporter MnhC subunit